MHDNVASIDYDLFHDGESPERSPEKGGGNGVQALEESWNRPGPALSTLQEKGKPFRGGV